MNLKSFPLDRQLDMMDCGPASLKMIAKYYGKYYSLQYLRDLCGNTREGASLAGISHGAESIGLRTLAAHCTKGFVFLRMQIWELQEKNLIIILII